MLSRRPEAGLLTKSPLIRKLSLLPLRGRRFLIRLRVGALEYQGEPPVLVNSFPKSGTHLLLQIVQGIPQVRTYGAFLASKPSLTFRERSYDSQARRLRRVVPGEALPAHLFFDERFRPILSEFNVVHLFIYRDPRDVVVSEAFYLSEMNRWHRLHGYFAKLGSLEECISTAILGIDSEEFVLDYPNVAVRFSRYAGWLSDDEALALRYEDLMGDGREDALTMIADKYLNASTLNLETPALVSAMESAIAPEKSHTYRKGGSGGWREAFTERNKAEMKRVAGQLLIDLGYERDLDW